MHDVVTEIEELLKGEWDDVAVEVEDGSDREVKNERGGYGTIYT